MVEQGAKSGSENGEFITKNGKSILGIKDGTKKGETIRGSKSGTKKGEAIWRTTFCTRRV